MTAALSAVYDTTCAYTVHSSPDDVVHAAVTGATWSETIGEDDVDVIFTNSRKTVSVTVTKTVDGDTSAGPYDFTASLKNGTANLNRPWTVNDNGTAADTTDDFVADANGDISFRLSHGESFVMTVPYGVTMTIEETSGGDEATTVQVGTAAAVTAQSVTLAAAQTVNDLTVGFTNVVSTIIPTGLNNDHTPYALIFASGGVLLGFGTLSAAMIRRKREEEEAAAEAVANRKLRFSLKHPLKLDHRQRGEVSDV